MKHVAFIIANNSSVPYFNWFAEMAEIKKDVKITFFALCETQPKMIDEVGKFGFECVWIKFSDKNRKKDWFTATIALYRELKMRKPDVVLSNLFDDAIPVVIAGFLAGIKRRIVVKADTGFHWYYARKGILFDYLINFLATDLVAISSESEEFMLQKEGARKSKITRIHHGIPIDALKTLVSNQKTEDFKSQFQLSGKTIIGSVARLIEWKGHMKIIEASLEICRKHPEVVFVFVGVGDEKDKLEKKIAELNLEKHFVFTGRIAPEDMPSVFNMFDVFLPAASLEPFGFVIIEAMAFSLPVISSSTGAAKDAIHHTQNGYLFPANSSLDLEKGIDWYFSCKNLDKVKTYAADIAKKEFDFGVMYDNYINLFNKVS